MIELLLLFVCSQALPYCPQAPAWTPPHFVETAPVPRFIEVPVTVEVKIPSRDDVVEGTSPGALTQGAPGHWEYRRVGLFRMRPVWIPGAAPAPVMVERGRQSEVPTPRGESPGAGCKTGGG
jgi:hypothetical protein